MQSAAADLFSPDADEFVSDLEKMLAGVPKKKVGAQEEGWWPSS
jgi:hypothetical protein